MIEIIHTNVAAIMTKKFPVIKEAPASNIFLKIIYIIVLKFLAAISIIIWILELSITRQISNY